MCVYVCVCARARVCVCVCVIHLGYVALGQRVGGGGGKRYGGCLISYLCLHVWACHA